MLLQKTVVSEILISVPGAGSSVYHHKKGKCIAFTEYRIMLFAVEELVVAVFWFNHRVPVVFRKFSVGFHITIKVKTATENTALQRLGLLDDRAGQPAGTDCAVDLFAVAHEIMKSLGRGGAVGIDVADQVGDLGEL